jgi:cullin 1
MEDKHDDIKMLYVLYKPIKEGLKPVADIYKSHLIDQGRNLVESCATQSEGKDLSLKEMLTNSNIVERILSLLTHNSRVIKNCFDSDTQFLRQLQLAFQVFTNLDIGKFSMAEFLAAYVDKLLRKGGSISLTASMEETIESVVTVFSHLTDKDLFLEVYRNQLARRLLQEKCEDLEHEKLLISNLKITCGLQQINKI